MLKKTSQNIARAIDSTSRLTGSLTPEGVRLLAALLSEIQSAPPLDRNYLLRAALKAAKDQPRGK